MQALRPTNLPTDFSSLEEEPVDSFEELQDEEESLAYIARTNGWQLITEEMDKVCEELDQMVVEAMQTGMSFEELGKRTAVKELTKDAIRRIAAKVEDARTASDGRAAE